MSIESIREIGNALARAVNLKTEPICVYGSDRTPERGVQASSVSNCIASAMYMMATGIVAGPIYAGYMLDQPFCRCIGGPAWFGYKDYDPRLTGIIATEGSDPKHLKINVTVSDETFRAVGKIEPIGSYVVMRSCDEVEDDPGVRSIACFATGEQVRDLCALAHFRSNDVFGKITVPWGPTCSSLVTYPAGMSENAPPDRIFLGPTDPSAREWLPEGYMTIGIPARVARIMAEDVEKSFLSR